jgi:hypothetical protein
MNGLPPLKIKTAPETPDAGYQPQDDLRHRPPPGGKMRDSLFWEMIMPDEQLGFQAYLYLTGDGKAGFNVVVWGPDANKEILDLVQEEVSGDPDFDNFNLAGLTLTQPDLRRTAVLRYESPKVKLVFDYSALHETFSYKQNPDGLPDWFAINRFEQTGWVKGFLEFNGRRVEWDRVGHRDHSWGMRNWGLPHHWKWFIAYTPDGGRIVNGWIWIAKGEWGFGGYVIHDGEMLPVSHIKHRAEYTDDMLQRRLEADLHDTRGGVTRLEMDSFGVVKLPTNDKMDTIIYEAACKVAIDGHAGAGQFETHWPKKYLEHLIAANKKR